MVQFINDNNLDIKVVLDAMAGRGIWSSYLLKISSLRKLILNDFSEDCYQYLREKFKGNYKVKHIWNLDFFLLDLSDINPDLLVIDFNVFTWNKKDQVNQFLSWLKINRKYFSYLAYADSFYYSLKFLKDEEERDRKYQEYLIRAQDNLKMELLFNNVYKSKNCSVLLLENKER
jgi:hypothetical protein